MANLKDTLAAVAALFAAGASGSVEEKRQALIAHWNAEIAATKSSWVKVRDNVYIALAQYASESILNWLASKVIG